MKILKRDISRTPLARDHFQRVIRCVGEWVLSSVFSVFCIRSCRACTFLQLRKPTSFLGKKGTSPLCLEKNMKEKSIKNLLRKRQTHFGPSRTRGQNCLFMSKICHHNEKPSATGLFTKGQNLVADGQTSKMPSTTSGAGQIETNFGKQ